MDYFVKRNILPSHYMHFIKSIFSIETKNISLTLRSIPLFRHPFILFSISYSKTESTLKSVIPNQDNFNIELKNNKGIYLMLLFSYEIHHLIHEKHNEILDSIDFANLLNHEEAEIILAEKVGAYLYRYHQKQKNPILEEALKLMQKHQQGINATMIARQLNISSRHLRRLTKQQTGFTPKTIIRLSRLKNTYLQISQGMPVEKALFNNVDEVKLLI